MKLLDEIKDLFEENYFDLEHETDMVQSRIISTILEMVEIKGMTQKKLESLTGLKQPFISALFNNKKKLSMEHIALFQHALKIILQPPTYLSFEEHRNKFYNPNDYGLFEIKTKHKQKEETTKFHKIIFTSDIYEEKESKFKSTKPNFATKRKSKKENKSEYENASYFG